MKVEFTRQNQCLHRAVPKVFSLLQGVGEVIFSLHPLIDYKHFLGMLQCWFHFPFPVKEFNLACNRAFFTMPGAVRYAVVSETLSSVFQSRKKISTRSLVSDRWERQLQMVTSLMLLAASQFAGCGTDSRAFDPTVFKIKTSDLIFLLLCNHEWNNQYFF